MIWGNGELKSGEEICSVCWRAMTDLDASKGPSMKRFTLEDVIYKLSSFKKSVHQKALETAGTIQAVTEKRKTESAEICPVCDIEITHGNKALWGSSKLKTGEKTCLNCWIAVSEIDRAVGRNMKNFTVEEIKKLLKITNPPAQSEPSLQTEVETPEEELPEQFADQLSPAEPAITESVTENKVPDNPPVTNRTEARLAAIGLIRTSYPELWQVQNLESELEAVLGEDEVFVAGVKGTYGKEHAALIATNRQLILISKKVFGGAATDVYDLRWVLSVDLFTAGNLSDVAFTLSANTIKVLDVVSDRAVTFKDGVKPLLSA